MGVMVGTNKPKFQCGSLKVKKIYKGTTQIYSSGNICTYTVRGVNYTQEYEEGQDVLHPTVVSPSLSGATFLGWSTSASSTSIVGSLVMGDSPIHLYAVFKYANSQAYSLAWQNAYNAIYLSQHQGVTVDKKVLCKAAPNMNTDIYESVVISTPNGTSIWIDKDNGAGYRYIQAWYSVGTNSSTVLATANYLEHWGEEGSTRSTNWNGKTITINVSKQGSVPVYFNAQLYQGNGFCSGGTYVGNNANGGTMTYIGRTVVG